MARGPLYQNNYIPQFSGHETFPPRYGWFKKVYDRVVQSENEPNNRSICWADDAIAEFGVGKNMLASMRHWAKAAHIIEEPYGTNSVCTTELGRMLFGVNGLDPYMENPASLWLIHWQLAAYPEKTTWFWAFSYFPAVTFDRDNLIKKLSRLAAKRNWSRVAEKTIQNDVACFIRTYVARQPKGKAGHDDSLESPLTELGIIKAIGKKDGFRFVRGQKNTLGDGVFAYALVDFWLRCHPNSATLSFEAIAHEPGGPGRVFLLDENDVADRLVVLDNTTEGRLHWSEAAGLKQVVCTSALDKPFALSLVHIDFNKSFSGRVG